MPESFKKFTSSQKNTNSPQDGDIILCLMTISGDLLSTHITWLNSKIKYNVEIAGRKLKMFSSFRFNFQLI